MGVCFSKKKAPVPPPPPNENIKKKNNTKEESTKIEAQSAPKQAPAVEKKQVFVIAHTPMTTSSSSTSSSSASDDAKNEKEKPKKTDPDPSSNVFVALPKPEGAVRTSSCTKEEVDAILIQCGRLSRSSSGKASNDAGHRKYSGSKRSYDFDNEKAEEADWDHNQVSRPSPRRRTPNRERSGSRERGSQRRVSRSPGRRSEGPAASSISSGKQQQPAKLVSVPAREKGVTNSAAAAAADNANVKRVSSAVANRRNASPRSRSPANNSRVSNENAVAPQPQSLSRSSSRKAEQSPFRRNPMSEIDDNRTQKTREGEEIVKKATQIQTQKTTAIGNCVRDQLMSCRAKEKQAEPEIVEEAKDPKGTEGLNHRTITRTRSSRRSSRDLDNILGLNPDSNNPNVAAYASLLLEDIHNAGFSLPACVTKACSILEAVADLNSSSSDQSNNDHGRFGRRGLGPKEPFMESEIVVKDDLMEPSLHKYVSVRDLGGGETEPQESAGSNSFGGQPWPSAWEPNSVDSTDRCLNSQPNNGEEVEENSRSRFRARGSSSNDSLQSAAGSSSNKKGGLNHHREVHQRGSGGGGGGGGGGIGKGGGRAYSLPVAAAASS